MRIAEGVGSEWLGCSKRFLRAELKFRKLAMVKVSFGSVASFSVGWLDACLSPDSGGIADICQPLLGSQAEVTGRVNVVRFAPRTNYFRNSGITQF